MINRAYRAGLFTATILLSRKLIEDLAYDILRIKFPQNLEGNLGLYFNEKDGRHHDFTLLLKNLESKKDEFGIDKETVSQFISLVKPFRLKANAGAHSIIIAAEEKDVLEYKIQKMIALLLRLRHLI